MFNHCVCLLCCLRFTGCVALCQFSLSKNFVVCVIDEAVGGRVALVVIRCLSASNYFYFRPGRLIIMAKFDKMSLASKLHFLLVLSLFCLPCALGQLYSDSILQNGGFESGLTSWGKQQCSQTHPHVLHTGAIRAATSSNISASGGVIHSGAHAGQSFDRFVLF